MKILLVAPNWVGDLVMSQSLMMLLKEQYQDKVEIDLLVTPSLSSLAARMPEVSGVIANSFSHGKLELYTRIKLGLSLKQNCYDRIIVLPNSFKSALVGLFAAIPERVGFVGEWRHFLLTQSIKLDRQKLLRMVDRFCALANNGSFVDQIRLPKLQVSATNLERLLQEHAINLSLPRIVFCPGAEYGPAKMWPISYFEKLSIMLIAKGFQIVVLGSAKDIVHGEIIAGDKKEVFNLCGKTNLADAVDLLADASYVVTNDSGLMHVACAVDASVIAIYGSTSCVFTPPLSDKAQVMQIKLDCAPCFKRTCKFEHYNCLRMISPEDVMRRIGV